MAKWEKYRGLWDIEKLSTEAVEKLGAYSAYQLTVNAFSLASSVKVSGMSNSQLYVSVHTGGGVTPNEFNSFNGSCWITSPAGPYSSATKMRPVYTRYMSRQEVMDELPKKGSFIEIVEAPDGTYPDDGPDFLDIDNPNSRIIYWYVLIPEAPPSLRILTEAGIETIETKIMTSDGLKPLQYYVMTQDGLKELT